MDPKKYLSMEDAIKILNNIIEDYNNQYKSDVLNIGVVALQKLIEEYSNLKQIEEAHRIENGKLREEITYSTKITPKQCKQLIEKGREEIKNKIKQKYLELVYEQNEGKNIVENRYKMEVLEEIGDVYEIQ